MPTCRSITPAAWAHARHALVFYFSRRHGFDHAEDLAQDTLAALWNRPDFEFEKEDDFLRICYAFAAHVSQAGHRNSKREATETFDPALHDKPQGSQGLATHGLNISEIQLMLDETMRIGRTQLKEQDWAAICEAAGAIAQPDEAPALKDNNSRVRLFRARRKLADLTGWRKSRM
jgi:DNA-directed RNA polymerase specialized sigma24 family protein